MSVSGRLDFTDLDSPQAGPPAARAERAHRGVLRQVHSELHRQHMQREELQTPPGSPTERRMGTPESYRLISSEQASRRTTPSIRSSLMSDHDMVEMLTARLEDAMMIVSMQKRLLKEPAASYSPTGVDRKSRRSC